jgi:hypothetical protein
MLIHLNDHDPFQGGVFEPEGGTREAFDTFRARQGRGLKPQRCCLPVQSGKRIGHSLKLQRRIGNVRLFPDHEERRGAEENNDRYSTGHEPEPDRRRLFRVSRFPFIHQTASVLSTARSRALRERRFRLISRGDGRIALPVIRLNVTVFAHLHTGNPGGHMHAFSPRRM